MQAEQLDEENSVAHSGAIFNFSENYREANEFSDSSSSLVLSSEEDNNFVASGKRTVKQYSNYGLFLGQIRNLIVALLVAVIVYLIPIHAFQNTRFVYFLFFASVILQLLVFFPFFQVKS